jgi:hypothetical protein
MTFSVRGRRRLGGSNSSVQTRAMRVGPKPDSSVKLNSLAAACFHPRCAGPPGDFHFITLFQNSSQRQEVVEASLAGSFGQIVRRPQVSRRGAARLGASLASAIDGRGRLPLKYNRPDLGAGAAGGGSRRASPPKIGGVASSGFHAQRGWCRQAQSGNGENDRGTCRRRLEHHCVPAKPMVYEILKDFASPTSNHRRFDCSGRCYCIFFETPILPFKGTNKDCNGKAET